MWCSFISLVIQVIRGVTVERKQLSNNLMKIIVKSSASGIEVEIQHTGD